MVWGLPWKQALISQAFGMGPEGATLLQGPKARRRQGTRLRLLDGQFLPSWQAHQPPTTLLPSQGKLVIFSQFLFLVVLSITSLYLP